MRIWSLKPCLNPDLKHSIFAELDNLAPAHAILGTNTSSLSIADIAAATITTGEGHWYAFFQPVPIMKLLELIRHEPRQTAPSLLLKKRVKQWAKRALSFEMSQDLRPVDLAWCWATRPSACSPTASPAPKTSIPPWCWATSTQWALALTDLVGLDVRQDILLNLQRSFNDDAYAPPLLEHLVAEDGSARKQERDLRLVERSCRRN